MKRPLKRPAAATAKKKLQTSARIRRESGLKPNQETPASADGSSQQVLRELHKSMPVMPSDLFGLGADSKEDLLSVGVDDAKPGVHYFGEDGWDCAAGGGHDEIQFKVDVDFGSFYMPSLLGRTFKRIRGLKEYHGSKSTEISAEVSYASINDVFSRAKKLTYECQGSLDPDIRYPHAIPLESMVDNFAELCKNFELQGPKVVAAVKLFMGDRSNDQASLFHARIQSLHEKQCSGHIWGTDDPAGELEELEMELGFQSDGFAIKRIQKRIAQLQEQWRGYNDSSYERRDDVTMFIYRAGENKAFIRVRIAKRVYRSYCCINPFTGDVEL